MQDDSYYDKLAEQMWNDLNDELNDRSMSGCSLHKKGKIITTGSVTVYDNINSDIIAGGDVTYVPDKYAINLEYNDQKMTVSLCKYVILRRLDSTSYLNCIKIHTSEGRDYTLKSDGEYDTRLISRDPIYLFKINKKIYICTSKCLEGYLAIDGQHITTNDFYSLSLYSEVLINNFIRLMLSE